MFAYEEESSGRELDAILRQRHQKSCTLPITTPLLMEEPKCSLLIIYFSLMDSVFELLFVGKSHHLLLEPFHL